MIFISKIKNLHDQIFKTITILAGTWFLSTAARLGFLAVLFFYYLNSASTKVGEGFAGFFEVSFGAYIQILSEAGMVAYDFEIANVPFLQKCIVYLGTYSEFILPILIVIGLFTRLAALGMIGFIFVQSYVDITAHGLDEGTIGTLFDRDPSSLIMDQRALWIFLLLVLVVKGAGLFSLDTLVCKWWKNK
ncbi:MAG: DoxX family protein [Nitratireductor sp.]